MFSKHLSLPAFVLLFYFAQLTTTKYHQHQPHEQQFKNFTMKLEKLVLNTTGRALILTKNVYMNMQRELSPQMLQVAQSIIDNYTRAVDIVLAKSANYKERRLLLQQFKYNNNILEHLRQQLDPLRPQKLRINLLSDEFVNERRNVTSFDNLYLEFMNTFEQASNQLWDNMSEEFVENNEELLEILDEISNEQQLPEKDKLYDEFIEMYLFKNNHDIMNRKNNELEDLDYNIEI